MRVVPVNSENVIIRYIRPVLGVSLRILIHSIGVLNPHCCISKWLSGQKANIKWLKREW